MTDVTISQNAAHWLATGSRGLSSEALFSMTTGLDIRGGSSLHRFREGWRHPYDPDDFQRCERMLRAVPEARSNFAAAKTTPEWTVLIDHWDELVALMQDELPGIFDGQHGRAPRSYARMQELLDPIRKSPNPNP